MEITTMKTLTRFGTHLVRSLVLAVTLLIVPTLSSAAVFVSVAIAPPVLPVYAQPPVPGPGYIWTPGYWAYGPLGYYWVPGTWVLAPFVGALWTPGYWGWGGSAFIWHAGYWGPRIGFYGGVNYGFGYVGVGFVGGSWNGGVYRYNTAVTNVNVTNNTYNTYNQTVVQNNSLSRVSYNGGTGGITAQPTAEERAAERDVHQAPTPLQQQHQQLASSNRSMLASVNHGTPALAATPRAAAFKQASTPGTNARAQYAGQQHSVAGQQSMSHVQGQGQYAQHPQGQQHYQSAQQPQGQQHYQSAQQPQGQQHYQSAPHPHPSESSHEETRH
jgi:hypothetical protein